MRDPEQFDAFYADARERLLVQTFALTGDLSASRRAVRDAFIVAWHHWRKNVRLDDPEAVIRPHAWRLAQRRHTARVWHRDKSIDPEVRAVLDALGKLSTAQRKALILTQLASVSMPQMAREVGLPREAAERELQSAAAQVSMALDISTPALRTAFDTVAASVIDTVHWPRTTIVRRAGAARRRTHTTLGVAGAAAAVLISGAVVTSANGVRPTLDRAPTASSAATPAPGPVIPPPPVEVLPTSAMLPAADLSHSYPRKWKATSTHGNDDGSGLVLPCQLERFADPRGEAALVREFAPVPGAKRTGLRATQLVEASRSERRAERTFDTFTDWFAGCTDLRVQLLTTVTPERVGEEALQVVLRSWARPVTTYVATVARTGRYTAATVFRAAGDSTPDKRSAANVIAAAVNRLCVLEGGGACATKRPDLAARDPLPVGATPAMLAEIDLPPVGDVRKPWVGTQPRKAVTNDAASACDSTSFRGEFRGARFSNNSTRTFVIPETKLPQEFGLTETVASLPTKRAKALVDRVRERLSTCSDRDLNTRVQRLVRLDTAKTSVDVWRLEIEVSDTRSVTFWMAMLRDGTSVAQIGFLPAPGADMKAGSFVALTDRAAQRLAELPSPRKAGGRG